MDTLATRVKVTGTMHKEIVLILWVDEKERVPDAGAWDFANDGFASWVEKHHVNPICSQHSSTVCKMLSDPRTGAHPMLDICQPWVDVLCCVRNDENIRMARSFGMRDNQNTKCLRKWM